MVLVRAHAVESGIRTRTGGAVGTGEVTMQNAPTLPLWPLPLVAGLLPAAGAMAALQISIHNELIPACNPLFEGCVSVSRAGRHGLANIVFRAALLPAAALQGLTWIVCSRWLPTLPGADARVARGARWMAGLGVTAAVFLVLYGTFLGTEGAAYRWLRQYGTVVWFGFTFLCMLLLAGRLRADAAGSPGGLRADGARSLNWRLSTALYALCWTLLLLGIGNTMLGGLFDPDTKDRIENVTEWWAALAFTLVFVLIAVLWRGARLVARLDAH